MYNIITIERRYASGGNEIGKRLAESLGFRLYDRNILIEAAKNLDIPFAKIEGLEESSSGTILLNLSRTPLGGFSNNKDLPLADKLFLEEKRIIEEAADAEREDRVAVAVCDDRCLKSGGYVCNPVVRAYSG